MPSWFADPVSERGRKLERTLVRYLSRMTARPTPFGLFAGSSLGEIEADSCLTIGGRDACMKHTRLDMDYLTELSSRLGADPALREELTFDVNSSLYEVAGRLRYAEVSVDGRERSYGLVAVDKTDYLLETLSRAAGGAMLHELVDTLADEDVSHDDARGYIDALLDSQILVPDVEPEVTGREPVGSLVARLQATQSGHAFGVALEDARAALDKIDAQGLGADRADHEAVARRLEDLPAPVDLGRLFQVDMTRPAPSLALGRGVVAELVAAVDVLTRIVGAPPQQGVERFRAGFAARYEGREVPLLEVLDEEFGIGFERSDEPSAEASPLLDGLQFPAKPPDASWTRQHTHLLRLLHDATAAHAQEIVLSNADLDTLSDDEPAVLPDAFAVPAVLAAASARDLDRGRFSAWVHGAYGPSGARLFGRFCHADGELRERVVEHLRAEEALRPDALFAEVVHLPEGRVGNILLRPVLRGYEIPYLGRSAAPPERQVPVSDLTVSVAGGRVVLRSTRLGREIVPRLTSAHNYSWRSLGVYRFLCALQNQDSHGAITWRWGPLDRAPFLPRVTRGRCVLSRARWVVDVAEFADAVTARGAAERFEALRRWRQRRRIPRWAALADRDNELLVDFENAIYAESFLHLASRRRGVRLVEAWPEPDELPVTGPDGRYVAEVVVPFVAAPATPPLPRVLRSDPRPVARTFPPGSEWVYAKVYTGTSTADRVLSGAIRPLVRALTDDAAIDRWFFVRYSDPDWHLRVRLHCPSTTYTGDVLRRVNSELARLLDEGLAWKVQLDTYQREVERYGGGIAAGVAELVFSCDSDAVLEMLQVLEGDETSDVRWRLALRGVHDLFDDFGFDLPARSKLVRTYRDAFAREFRADVLLKRQLGQKHRNERRVLEALVQRDPPADPAFRAGMAALRRRSSMLAPHVASYRRLDASGELTSPLGEIVMSFTHMHVNRLLRSAHRAQELVLYDLLVRLYASLAARS
ncbi:MAG: lantibiotic dehydratase [Actinomycetota bacterium]|nr:lantibiotic dehydratase [Actinomycetota bacterium]